MRSPAVAVKFKVVWYMSYRWGYPLEIEGNGSFHRWLVAHACFNWVFCWLILGIYRGLLKVGLHYHISIRRSHHQHKPIQNLTRQIWYTISLINPQINFHLLSLLISLSIAMLALPTHLLLVQPPIPFDFKASHSSATSPPLTRLAAIEPVTALHGWYTATASATQASRISLFLSLVSFLPVLLFFAGRGWCGRKRRPVSRDRLGLSGKAFSKRQTSWRAGGLLSWFHEGNIQRTLRSCEDVRW